MAIINERRKKKCILMPIENERFAFLLLGRSPFDLMNSPSSTKRKLYAIRIALEKMSTWKMYANKATHNCYERNCSVCISVKCSESKNTIITTVCMLWFWCVWSMVFVQSDNNVTILPTKHPIYTDKPKSVSGRCYFPYITHSVLASSSS